MKIIRGISQNTPEWDFLRLGSLGGYGMRSVLAKGKKGGKSEGYKKVLGNLAYEKLTGKSAGNLSLPQFDRGHEWEGTALDYYEITTGNKVEQVAMIQSDVEGHHHSPDGIMEYKRGGVEIKTRSPHIFFEQSKTKTLPVADQRQDQNFLSITGWNWIDHVVYCVPDDIPNPSFTIRVYPDPIMIREIRIAVRLFIKELDELVTLMKKV